MQPKNQMKKFNEEMEFIQNQTYVTYKGKKCEICLEPCFNGCDVAVYDLGLNLLEPKFCTNLQGFDPFNFTASFEDSMELRSLAFEKAQEYYEKYEK